jgi:selenide, water dikinase
MSFDLLTTVESGGCSAKLNPEDLEKVLAKLPPITDPNFLVDSSTHDDAGVYKINDETAIIFTTDFFPPVCSDAYDFGQIAAANALSDVYAMGGKPLMALNIMMFSIDRIPKEVLENILRGGADKAKEAGCFIVGGHTIDDYPPKYGMAVVGTVHPKKLLSNAAAKQGDTLILTKGIGTGALIAAEREGLCSEAAYKKAIDSMKSLNKLAAEIMQNYQVHSATDITGFALAGHALEMAKASKLSLHIDSRKVPLLDEAYQAYDDGCIPGACFRNYNYAEKDCDYAKEMDYNLKLLMHDAQTSGGLLISVAKEDAEKLSEHLQKEGVLGNIIGEVKEKEEKALYLY